MSSSFRGSRRPKPPWLINNITFLNITFLKITFLGITYLALVIGLLLLFRADVQGQQPVTGAEYRVKAGFIYHFARFTQWPKSSFSSPTGPLLLCVASTRPETDFLLALQGKRVRNRNIVVRKYRAADEPPDCHILFISSDDRNFVLKQLQTAAGTYALTVGETEDFNRAGGIMSFFLEEDRLRFRVNLDAAERAGLKFSSQLLMSAEIFRETPE